MSSIISHQLEVADFGDEVSLVKVGFGNTAYHMGRADDPRVGVMDIYPFIDDEQGLIADAERIGRILVSVPEVDQDAATLVTSRLGQGEGAFVAITVPRNEHYASVEWTTPTYDILEFGAHLSDINLAAAHQGRLDRLHEIGYRIFDDELGATNLHTVLHTLTSSAVFVPPAQH